jgi:hypothetical protein
MKCDEIRHRINERVCTNSGLHIKRVGICLKVASHCGRAKMKYVYMCDMYHFGEHTQYDEIHHKSTDWANRIKNGVIEIRKLDFGQFVRS